MTHKRPDMRPPKSDTFIHTPIVFPKRERISKKYIVPVQDLDGYLTSLRRHGASEEEIILARRRNTPGDPLNCIITKWTETIYPGFIKNPLKAVKKFKRSL